MKIASIDEAETALSALIDRAVAGEEVIISQSGKPMVRLVACEPKQNARIPGLWRGKVKMSDDFDAPLPDEIMRGFLGTSE